MGRGSLKQHTVGFLFRLLLFHGRFPIYLSDQVIEDLKQSTGESSHNVNHKHAYANKHIRTQTCGRPCLFAVQGRTNKTPGHAIIGDLHLRWKEHTHFGMGVTLFVLSLTLTPAVLRRSLAWLLVFKAATHLKRNQASLKMEKKNRSVNKTSGTAPPVAKLGHRNGIGRKSSQVMSLTCLDAPSQLIVNTTCIGVA